MVDQKQSKSPSDRDERTDADAAQAESVHEDSSVIYFCSAEEISEGSAIALRAMGFKTEILLSDILPQSNTTSNPEDR